MSAIIKIVLEVVEEDGQVTQRVLDLTGEGQTVLECTLSTDFNPKNRSETFTLFVERVTSKSREYADYIRNPFWK
jgi:hypothetical protein